MTNLDSVLKSRDITLHTKVHIVKAMDFPVVMNRCENWKIKNKPNRQSNLLRKKSGAEGIKLPYFKLSSSHLDNTVLAQKQKYRPTEQDRKPGNKST